MSHTVTEAQRLTVYLTESARYEGRPLFEWLTRQAVRLGVAGATVTKGLVGYGRHHQVHHAHLVELSDDLPVIFQCVDTPGQIQSILADCQSALHGHTYTLEDVKLHKPMMGQ